MKKYGALTPKRSVLWSSSKEIRWFRTGKLKRGKGAESAKSLVNKYKNRRGETRFQGNRNMAKSAILVLDVSVFLFIELISLFAITCDIFV